MKCWKWVLGAVMVLTLGRTGFAADPIKDDPQLSPDQKKQLLKFQASLANRPNNPNDADKHLQDVQANMKKLFAVNNAPSGSATDALAATLVRGLNNGQIPATQSILLAKELSKVLNSKEITSQSANQFVKTIDPLVQQTGLSPTEKLRLYREVLVVIKTTPTYVPR